MPFMKFRITLPAPSLSVTTIIFSSLASFLKSEVFSLFLNTPKPSVVIITPSITDESLILSYFPSHITGYFIFSFSISQVRYKGNKLTLDVSTRAFYGKVGKIAS